MTTALQSQHRKKAFLLAFARCGNISRSAIVAKVSRITIYDWKRDDPEFLLAYEQAEQEAADALETEARRRAIDGSDVLLIFLLKGARPEKYKDRFEHTGANGGPVEHRIAGTLNLTALSDAQLDELDALVGIADGSINVINGVSSRIIAAAEEASPPND